MDGEQIEIKLFTVADLRDWLFQTREVEGLSLSIISTTRANAIINNPYVKDDDPVAAAIYESGKVAAFTASFPDMLNGKRVWWFSSLWCNKEYRGKGYPLIIIGSLCEAREGEEFFDMWGAQETVEIFNYLGLKCTYFNEYTFRPRSFDLGTVKGWFENKVNEAKRRNNAQRNAFIKRMMSADYRVQYVDIIDDKTYKFISDHAENDLWLRSQEMMNWTLGYSFRHRGPLYRRTVRSNYFTDNRYVYWKGGVRVFCGEELVGYYVISEETDCVSLKYLYYDKKFEEQVFLSIVEHIKVLNKERFTTRNKSLADFVKAGMLFDCFAEEKVSFSYPDTFEIKEGMVSQGGDGDGFV